MVSDRSPGSLRFAAVQTILLSLMAGMVLAVAEIAFTSWTPSAQWLVWGVVAFSTVSLEFNLITPDAPERRIWAQVAVMLVASSVIVTLRPP